MVKSNFQILVSYTDKSVIEKSDLAAASQEDGISQEDGMSKDSSPDEPSDLAAVSQDDGMSNDSSPDEPSDLAAVSQDDGSSQEDGISHEDGMSKDSSDPSDLAAGLAEAAMAKEIMIKAIIFTLRLSDF